MLTKNSTIGMYLRNIKGKNKTKLIFDKFKIILPKQDLPFSIGDDLGITYIDSYISEGKIVDMFQMIDGITFTSRDIKGEIPVSRDIWSIIRNSVLKDGDYSICYNRKENKLYYYNIYEQDMVYTSTTMSKEKAEEIIHCIQNNY